MVIFTLKVKFLHWENIWVGNYDDSADQVVYDRASRATTVVRVQEFLQQPMQNYEDVIKAVISFHQRNSAHIYRFS